MSDVCKFCFSCFFTIFTFKIIYSIVITTYIQHRAITEGMSSLNQVLAEEFSSRELSICMIILKEYA